MPRSSWITRREPWLLVSITAVALFLRLWGITFGLPFTQARPDEGTILTKAINLWMSGPNPHFFNYPTLYIYVMAVAVRVYVAAGQMIGHVAHTDVPTAAMAHVPALHVIDRVTVALLGTATVPILYWGTKRLLGLKIAAIAAAFASVAFLLVRDSHFGVTDIPATFMIVLAFGIIVTRPLDARHWKNAVGAGIVCGLAASTKYNAAIILAPLAIAAGSQEWESTRRLSTTTALLVLVGISSVIGFLIGTPFAVLDYPAFRSDVLAERTHLLEGHALSLGTGWWRHLTVSLWYGVGWPMLAAALAGIVVAALADRKRAAVLLAFPILYYIAIGAGQTVFVRYAIPLVPFICILAALTVHWIAVKTVSVTGRRSAGLAMAAMLTVAILIPNLARSVAFDRVLSATDTRVLAANAVAAAYPSGATFYEISGEYTRLQLPPAFQPWTENPAVNPVDAPPGALPQVVIVSKSLLTLYTPPLSDIAREALRRRYRLTTTFDVEESGRFDRLVYDEQDAFFVPLDGFSRIRRPGPAIDIFTRLEK